VGKDQGSKGYFNQFPQGTHNVPGCPQKDRRGPESALGKVAEGTKIVLGPHSHMLCRSHVATRPSSRWTTTSSLSSSASLAGKTRTVNQIQFVNLVIDYLTQSGWMRAAQLYESPFTDYSPCGVEGVFDSAQVTQLLSILDNIRQPAAAS
jgi:hypothetical protein